VALGFAAPADEQNPNWAMLQGQYVMASVELGQYAGLANVIDDTIARCPSEARTFVDAAKTFHDLNRGTWSPREIAGGRQGTFAAAAMVLNAAYCTDNAETIEAALNQARAVMQAQMPLNRNIVARGERVLKAMRGKLPPTLEEAAGRSIASEFAAATFNAQLLRLAGDKRAAAHIQQAQRCLDTFPAEQTPNPFQLGLHLRNAIAGIEPDTRDKPLRTLRERASEICRQRIRAGHGLLAAIQN
jgi:hypothetical protein